MCPRSISVRLNANSVFDAAGKPIDLDRGDEEPEVLGHRLLEGQQIEALLFDLDIHPVDDSIAFDDPFGFVGVPLEECFDGELDRGLRLAGHREQPDLDLAQLVVKMPVAFAGHPNLPVI